MVAAMEAVPTGFTVPLKGEKGGQDVGGVQMTQLRANPRSQSDAGFTSKVRMLSASRITFGAGGSGCETGWTATS